MIAPGRARRPGAARGLLEPPTPEELDACPFCDGREDRTPPETLALGRSRDAPDTPGWRVRVVPNLYPAFERQEVVIHSPHHARSLAELHDEQLELVAAAWQARAQAARADGFAYVQALVNEGREAGASLPHTHSQLVWLRDEPPLVAAERSGDACAVCAALELERADGSRDVLSRDGLVAFAPYASRAPYELFIAPVEHAPDAFGTELLAVALQLLAEALRRVAALEGPLPLNAWVHTGQHWHIEALPRLAIIAGVELGAGIYVNSLLPEQAAQALRSIG